MSTSTNLGLISTYDKAKIDNIKFIRIPISISDSTNHQEMILPDVFNTIKSLHDDKSIICVQFSNCNMYVTYKVPVYGAGGLQVTLFGVVKLYNHTYNVSVMVDEDGNVENNVIVDIKNICTYNELFTESKISVTPDEEIIIYEGTGTFLEFLVTYKQSNIGGTEVEKSAKVSIHANGNDRPTIYCEQGNTFKFDLVVYYVTSGTYMSNIRCIKLINKETYSKGTIYVTSLCDKKFELQSSPTISLTSLQSTTAKIDLQYFYIDLTGKISMTNLINNHDAINISSYLLPYFETEATGTALINVAIRYESMVWYVNKGEYGGGTQTYSNYNFSGILELSTGYISTFVATISLKHIIYQEYAVSYTVPAEGKWFRIGKINNSTNAYATFTLNHSWNHQQPGFVKFMVGCGWYGSGKNWTIRKIAEDTGFIRRLRTNYNNNDNVCYIEMFLQSTSINILSTPAEIAAYGSKTEGITVRMTDAKNVMLDHSTVTLLNTQMVVRTHGIIEYCGYATGGGKCIIPMDAKFVYIYSMTDDEDVVIELDGCPADLQYDITIYAMSGHGGTNLVYNFDRVDGYSTKFVVPVDGKKHIFKLSPTYTSYNNTETGTGIVEGINLPVLTKIGTE